MTHEELLARVDLQIRNRTSALDGLKNRMEVLLTSKRSKARCAASIRWQESQLGSWNALRAVVELHKPTQNRSVEGWCDECVGHYLYPCPTIQAIEEEMK